MHRIMLTVTAAGALSLWGVTAQAFPVVPSSNSDTATVTLVSGGCGPLAHRGDDEECHPNRGPGGVLGAVLGVDRGGDRRDEYRRRHSYERRDYRREGEFRRHRQDDNQED